MGVAQPSPFGLAAEAIDRTTIRHVHFRDHGRVEYDGKSLQTNGYRRRNRRKTPCCGAESAREYSFLSSEAWLRSRGLMRCIRALDILRYRWRDAGAGVVCVYSVAVGAQHVAVGEPPRDSIGVDDG